MNYALDALWWRLTNPQVRDLASLLTAPALWHSGCELSVRQLLGEQGFRFLLALDERPQPLQQFLATHQPYGQRLGIYAEHLLCFWFSHAPHTRLLAHNLPVMDENNKQTLGALDFVAELDGQIYHIELACKYYGDAAGVPERMCGLNQADCLTDKAAKLSKQLAWSAQAAGKEVLAHIGVEHIQSASIVRGIGFSTQTKFTAQPLNQYAWAGEYVCNWDEAKLLCGTQQNVYLLPRMSLLAPARVQTSQLTAWQELILLDKALVAVVEKRPDGYWHEIQRIMMRKAT